MKSIKKYVMNNGRIIDVIGLTSCILALLVLFVPYTNNVPIVRQVNAAYDVDTDPVITTIEELENYSQMYSTYGEKHQYDIITIQLNGLEETDKFENFVGIGSSDYPFAGEIIINATSTDNMRINCAFFNYVYDYVVIRGVSNDKILTISPIANFGGKATFAEHVCHDTREGVVYEDDDGADPNSSSVKHYANWTLRTGDYNSTSYNHGSLIGEIQSNAKVTVNVINNSNGDIVASGNLGLVCGTMKSNSQISVASVSSSNASQINTSGGHAGGLVGEMEPDSVLRITGDSSDYHKPASTIKTTGDNKYAGGIVGLNAEATVVVNEYTTINSTVNGKSGAGGVFGYYRPAMADSTYSFDTDKFTINRCTVASSSGGAGGVFGVLINQYGTINISGKTKTVYSKSTGNKTVYGGLIGIYQATDLDYTLNVSGRDSTDLSFDTTRSDSPSCYGGVIGRVNGTSFVSISDVSVNAASPSVEYFGGAIARIDDGYAYIKDFDISASSTCGGGVVGHSENGVIHLAGNLDLSSASSSTGNSHYGQIVGYRDNAIVFADSSWTITRNTNSNVAADDIGSWGEVVRFKSSGFDIDDVLSSYYNPSDSTPSHYVVLQSASTTLSDKATFAKAALNMQLNDGNSDTDSDAVLRFADVSSSNYSALMSESFELSDDIDLRHTGMTGLTRDNIDSAWSSGIGPEYEGSSFNGNDHTLTLAIGEGYEGNDSQSPSDESGKGKIYTHRFNGLFGSTTSSFEISNVIISGKVCTYTKEADKLNAFYVGSVIGYATSEITVDNVTLNDSVVFGTSNRSDKTPNVTIFVGGIVGKMEMSGASSFTNSVFSANISGTSYSDNTFAGGIAGYVEQEGNYTLSVNNVQLGGKVANDVSKPRQIIGGLFAVVSGSKGKITLDTVNVNGLTVSGKMGNNNNGSDDADDLMSMGGLLGYRWDTVIASNGPSATFDSVSITNCKLSNCSSKGRMAGLVYMGSGFWRINSVTISGLNLDGSASDSLGMIVNKAWAAQKSMYLELPRGFTYTISGVSGTMNSADVFDEIAAYSKIGTNDIEANGNAIVSISTSRTTSYGTISDTQVNMTSGSCNTYQNQISISGLKKYNPNTRYYYNIDLYRTSASNASRRLFMYSVRQYAHSSIQSLFTSGNTNKPSFSGALDLNGLSYYPFDLSAELTINGTLIFHNKDIENQESASGGDIFERTTKYDDTLLSSTQHYLMHAGLFRNVTGTVKINGALNLDGTILETNGYCGAIVCGTLAGTTDAQAKVDSSSGSIVLDGVKVGNFTANSSDENYIAPLLIRNTDGYVTLNIFNVTATSSKYVNPSDNTKTIQVATSLIGTVGTETAVRVQVKFDNIKLDGRLPDNSTETNLTTTYGTSQSLFTRATLLHSLSYSSGSASYGIYNYTHAEDWVSGRKVTYGSEISNIWSKNFGKEFYYKDNFDDPEYFTNPKEDSTSVSPLPSSAYDFSGFYPYVFINGNKIGSSTATKHQLDVNHGAATFEGCGTYNHPFHIIDGGELETIANIIEGVNISTNFGIELPESLDSTWCNGRSACHWYKYNSVADKFLRDDDPTEVYDVDDVRKYLLGAYYYLDNDDGITLSEDYIGLGVTGDLEYAFRGVIVGDDTSVKNKSSSPLINTSNGSVIKKIRINVDGAYIGLYGSNSSFSDLDGCPAYGAVIGKIFGGDNIIDQVGVNFSSETSVLLDGDAHLIPVGGYVGVIVDGGLVFRNMDSSHISSNLTKGITNSVFDDGSNHIDSGSNEYTAFLYNNAIIGRVINGYAVTEGSSYAPTDSTATMKNGTKNYSIADIVKSDKLTIGTSSTLEIGSAQQWFVLSLIVNDGKSLYLGTDKAVHHGSYNDVNTEESSSSDYSKIHGGTATDDDVVGTNGIPYLIVNFADGKWTNYNTGYKLSLSENGKWRLPDGYRGMGGINTNNSGCILKISGIDGNGTEITLNMKYQTYDSYQSDSCENYRPGDYGFGLFNDLKLSADATVKQLKLLGKVFTEFYKNDGTVRTSYKNNSYQADQGYCENVYKNGNGRLHCGMFAGMKSDTGKKLTLSEITIASVDVQSNRCAGGLIGKAANIKCEKIYASDLKIQGRYDTGGLLGYSSDGTDIIGEQENDGSAKSTVTINSVIMQTKGFKIADTNRAGSVGGLVGRAAGTVNIKNINMECHSGREGIVSYDNMLSNDSAASGGILGAAKSGTITIENCRVGSINLEGNTTRTGGVVGAAMTTFNIKNIVLDGNGTDGIRVSDASGYSKEPLGGVIGHAEGASATITIESVLIKNYTFTKNTTKTENVNYVGGCIGTVNNITIMIKDFFMLNCTFAGSSVNDSQGINGGLFGRTYNSPKIYGYNIVLKDIYNNLANQSKYRGDIIGYETPGELKIIGLSRQNTPTTKLINNSDTYTMKNTMYVIFSDYNGEGFDGDENTALPKINGTDITDMVDVKTPYANVNPSLTMYDNHLMLTSDGIYMDAISNVINDLITGTSKKRYLEISNNTKTQFIKNNTINTEYISSFSNEFGNVESLSGVTFGDMPILVVDDSTTADTVINRYLRLLTNTSDTVDFSYQNNKVYNGANIGDVTIYKCVYDSANNRYSLVPSSSNDSACLVINGSNANRTFSIYKDSSQQEHYDTENEGQFTLIDVKFTDPTNSNNKTAYHLYVPVIVKKLLEYSFDISSMSGTNYSVDTYVNNYGNRIVENLGTPVTMQFKYTYMRTAEEWAAEENTNYNYPKMLEFVPEGGNLDSATQMVLVDVARGGKAYYLDNLTSTAYYPKPGTDHTYILDLTKFRDLDGNYFTPVTFSEMLANNNGMPLTEEYYLSIFTPFRAGEAFQCTVVNSALEHPGFPTRRVDCDCAVQETVHRKTTLFLGDFYTNTLTVSTTTSNLIMDTSNSSISANLAATVTLNPLTESIVRPILSDSSVHIYETLLVSLDKYKSNNELAGTNIGSWLDANATYTITTATGSTTKSVQAVARANCIEFPNGVDISSHLKLGSVTLSADVNIGYYTEENIQNTFPHKNRDDDEDRAGAMLIGYSRISSRADTAAFSNVSIREEDTHERRYYNATETNATLNYNAVFSANNRTVEDNQLGVNALEVEGNSSTIRTIGVYDVSKLADIDNDQYILCEFTLKGKNQNSEDYNNTLLNLGNYLSSFVYGNSSALVYSTTSGTTYRFILDRSKVASDIEDVYSMPFDFDVITGGTFESSHYQYGNYRVIMTTTLLSSYNSETHAYVEDSRTQATDYLVYTNARMYTDQIKQ